MLVSLENKTKRAILQFDWELIKGIFSTGKIYGKYTVKQGIPKDAQILGIRNNNFGTNQDNIELIIASELLDETRIGDILPPYNIIIEQKEK